MKTTKIFMMAALALLMTSCSNDDNDQTAPKPNADGEITVTAKIDVNDGSALTRAVADNGTTITSGLAVDEQIAVLFSDGTSNLKRTATVKSIAAGTATIEFTIPSALANNTACTLVYPATAAKADNTDVDTYANLLAAQTGALGANLDVRKGTATILNDGETASLSGTPSLAAQFAIHKFTIQDLGGTVKDATEFKVSDASGNVITTVTPGSATGTLYVALPVMAAGTYWFNATIDSKPYIAKATTADATDAGKYYQTTVKMATLGDLMGADGKFYASSDAITAANTTAIGVIAYLGTDNFTENGTNVGGSTFVGHGLVLCLKNTNNYTDNTNYIPWSSTNYGASDWEFGSDNRVKDATDGANGLKRTNNVSGYSNTKILVDKANGTTIKYEAAQEAWNYAALPAPAGTTGWFLPSAQQWVKIQNALGKLNVNDIIWESWFDNSHTAADKWEAALAKAGAGNYDSMTSSYRWYWSSSEYSAYHAVRLSIDAHKTGNNYGFRWRYFNKEDRSADTRVRPVLAF